MSVKRLVFAVLAGLLFVVLVQAVIVPYGAQAVAAVK